MRTRRANQKGSTLVESALVLILFLAVFIGLFDVGEVLFMHQTIAHRTGTAARWGSVNPWNETSVRNMVLYGTPAPANGARTLSGLTTSNVAVARMNAGLPEDRIVVTVSGYAVGLFSTAITRLNSGSASVSRRNGLTVRVALPYEYASN